MTMPDTPSPAIQPDEVIEGGATADEVENVETISEPAKVLLDEVRSAPLDEAGRTRLKEIYEQSLTELRQAISADLAAELDRMTSPFSDAAPSEAELRVAQAQLVGWLEGLFHGIQATLVAQQMAARAQLDEMRSRGLPQSSMPPSERPGTYL